MKHQLQTIREFIESVHEGEWAPYAGRYEALTALAELERMAGEPVAWTSQIEIDWAKRNPGRAGSFYAVKEGPSSLPLYTAAPVAQQQYEAGDMASAHNDGFRAGVASVAQQPQAEPFGYVSQHTNGSWEFSPTPAGVYPDTAKSITAVYTKQPQTEAHQECDSRPICRVLKSCAGQYGSQRICSAAPQQAEAVQPDWVNYRQGLHDGWAEGYKQGVEDERTSEANIGIAGFGAKVNPARQNPYKTNAPQHTEAVPSDVVCEKDPRGCWNVRCQLGKVCKNAAAQGEKP